MYAKIVPAMERATNAWEAAGDIEFVHLDIPREECSPTAEGVRFSVRYRTGCFWGLCGIRGLAFFPSTAAKYRTLSFWKLAFENDLDLDRVVTHEVGHVLGLWHEHVRFPADEGSLCGFTGGADEEWRGVTARDSDSVMGYPSCPHTSPEPPHPSALDRLGLSYLYNAGRDRSAGGEPLIWFQPSTGERHVWSPNFEGVLTFEESASCWLPDCDAEPLDYWKPTMYRMSTDATPSVLMYGPGPIEDRTYAIAQDPATGAAVTPVNENNAVPIVLSDMFGAGSNSVLWHRPGPSSDRRWRFTAPEAWIPASLEATPFNQGFFTAAVGKFDPNLSSRTQALWHSPLSSKVYLMYGQDVSSFEFLEIGRNHCALEDGHFYNALPGNFDPDSSDELVWYDYDDGRLVTWWSITTCSNSAQTFTKDIGQGKVMAGIFSKSQPMDLMIYRTSGLVELFDPNSETVVWTRSMKTGRVPVLSDFDGDGCTDVLWYDPTDSPSSVWRSDCAGDFTDQPLVQAPPESFPIGYGPGHGRQP
ncbi:MAG: hypothetical protein HC927_06190 [Deltaproteobacteria bacterium]|nr:hypothetical protein [Deltaproteobacteria bacterium]